MATASTVSAPNTAFVGRKITITINSESSSYKHTLSYIFRGTPYKQSGLISANTDLTTISWTIPRSIYELMPTKEGQLEIECVTYSGDTEIGTTWFEVNVLADESECAPVITNAYVQDVTEPGTYYLTGDSSTLIRYYGTAQVMVVAAARQYAEITSVEVTFGSRTVLASIGSEGSNSWYTNIEGADTGTFKISVTDSRGCVTTQTLTTPMVNYVIPTCVLTKVHATNTGDVTFEVSGSFFNGTFGLENNALKLYYRYKVSGGVYSDYIEITDITLSENTYTATFSVSGLDYQKGYTFEADASDALYYRITSTAKTAKFIPVFDWGENDFQFNVPVLMPKNLYIGENGYGGLFMNNSDITGVNNIIFGDESGSASESIRFYRNAENWDCLYFVDGVLCAVPDYPTNTTPYKVWDADFRPYYEDGDEVTINSVYAGFVTGGGKTFQLHIPLSKIALAVDSISGSLTGRGVNGYVLDSYNNPIDLAGGDGYTVKVSVEENGIKITISYDESQTDGITNNTPISWHGAVTIKFLTAYG